MSSHDLDIPTHKKDETLSRIRGIATRASTDNAHTSVNIAKVIMGSSDATTGSSQSPEEWKAILHPCVRSETHHTSSGFQNNTPESKVATHLTNPPLNEIKIEMIDDAAGKRTLEYQRQWLQVYVNQYNEELRRLARDQEEKVDESSQAAFVNGASKLLLNLSNQIAINASQDTIDQMASVIEDTIWNNILATARNDCSILLEFYKIRVTKADTSLKDISDNPDDRDKLLKDSHHISSTAFLGIQALKNEIYKQWVALAKAIDPTLSDNQLNIIKSDITYDELLEELELRSSMLEDLFLDYKELGIWAIKAQQVFNLVQWHHASSEQIKAFEEIKTGLFRDPRAINPNHERIKNEIQTKKAEAETQISLLFEYASETHNNQNVRITELSQQFYEDAEDPELLTSVPVLKYYSNQIAQVADRLLTKLDSTQSENEHKDDEAEIPEPTMNDLLDSIQSNQSKNEYRNDEAKTPEPTINNLNASYDEFKTQLNNFIEIYENSTFYFLVVPTLIMESIAHDNTREPRNKINALNESLTNAESLFQDCTNHLFSIAIKYLKPGNPNKDKFIKWDNKKENYVIQQCNDGDPYTCLNDVLTRKLPGTQGHYLKSISTTLNTRSSFFSIFSKTNPSNQLEQIKQIKGYLKSIKEYLFSSKADKSDNSINIQEHFNFQSTYLNGEGEEVIAKLDSFLKQCQSMLSSDIISKELDKNTKQGMKTLLNKAIDFIEKAQGKINTFCEQAQISQDADEINDQNNLEKVLGGYQTALKLVHNLKDHSTMNNDVNQLEKGINCLKTFLDDDSLNDTPSCAMKFSG